MRCLCDSQPSFTMLTEPCRGPCSCLVESQLLSLRSRLSTVLTSITEGRPTLGSPPRLALGLGFEPWDADSLPRRVLVTSSPLQESCVPSCCSELHHSTYPHLVSLFLRPAIMGVLADVFGSNVLKDRTQHLGMIEESPSSGALGAANLGVSVLRPVSS